MKAKLSFALGRKPTKKEAAWLKLCESLVNATIEIDHDALVRDMAKNLGMPRHLLRSKEEVVLFRKRSAASKLGWKKRRRA